MNKFKPPQSEANVHVNQLHKGQHLLPKKNKAITRVILGREDIVGDNSLPKSSFQTSEQVEHENLAKSEKVMSKHFTKPTLHNYPHTIDESREEPTRCKSPLKPPKFYTVRLSNAPIFLRRTTLRPPTLEFLNRSPRRSPSPAPRSSSHSPVNRGHSPIHGGHSPVKREVFVKRKDIRNNAISKEFASIVTEEKITEENIIKLISEAVQTGPLKKTHGTQMTPYDSEASDIACILFIKSNLIDAPQKTIKSQTVKTKMEHAAKNKRNLESERIDDESLLFLNKEYVYVTH